jgi:hypothetical protein
MPRTQFEHKDFMIPLMEGKTAAEAHVLWGVAATPQIHVGEELGEERVMPGLGLTVGLRLLTPLVRTYGSGIREEVIGVDMIRVGMGIDQEADRLIGNAADFRQQVPGHGGIGQAVDHYHVPLANYYSGASVPDQGRLQKGVDIFGKFAEFMKSGDIIPFIKVVFAVSPAS